VAENTPLTVFSFHPKERVQTKYETTRGDKSYVSSQIVYLEDYLTAHCLPDPRDDLICCLRSPGTQTLNLILATESLLVG